MTSKSNQPVYRAAADTAHAELRQIADRLSQLRARQEQIATAVVALKLLVNGQDSALPVSAGKSVYEMGRTPQSGKEGLKLQALA
jgi:hypothetical protein